MIEMTTRSRRWCRHAALFMGVAAIAVVSSGCGTQSSVGVGDGAAGAQSEPFNSLADLWWGSTYEEDPVSSPQELLRLSDLVVAGQVIRVVNGRTQFCCNPAIEEHSVVLTVAPAQWLKGGLPSDSDGNVYVELDNPHNISAQEVASAIPNDATFALYLEAAPADASVYSNPDAGRPDGQTLWRPYSLAQGFIMSTGAGTSPVYGYAPLEVPLRRFLPPRRTFPSMVTHRAGPGKVTY